MLIIVATPAGGAEMSMEQAAGPLTLNGPELTMIVRSRAANPSDE
jgi:hypothetical protein